MKKVLSIILAAALAFNIVPSSAQNAPSPKEEVIYGILNHDGSVDNLYAVNIFSGGAITDYGDYTDIRNLTTSEQINVDGDKITANTEADRFYYQGTLKNKELPWDIAIKYYLDGREISADDLGGKTGALKIQISVKQNNKVNSTFFDNYALQITLALDNSLCSNIAADNATIAEAGSKKQLAFTVLPGKGADIEVTADVRDFEMDPISINGIRLAFDIDIDTGEFTEQVAELTDAVKGLDDGASELLDGITQLSDGMQRYINGVKAFKDGLGKLTAGIDRLNTGAAQIKGGLSELTKQNDSILAGALAMQQAIFDSVNSQLAGMALPVLTPQNYSAI
ncbi:MAG TPA: hypothetical protein PLZ84_01945, partial [Clostridia bacterium]|nr:hypothetical protein [Clostridia bacterium]